METLDKPLLVRSWRCFDGTQYVYRHASRTTKVPMDFAVYVPDIKPGETLPVLTFLSGLTCNWENFTAKAGAQRYASAEKLILVMPDTSPRGDSVPNDPAYDLGQGAGFYVDATEAPWATHFQMYSYIADELPDVVAALVPTADFTCHGISGHSMGGHGALVMALRNPGKYTSVSAIAPIAAPMQCAWGQKIFSTYLGLDQDQWKQYDAAQLVAGSAWNKPILIDQGANDEFLLSQLKPELFMAACKAKGLDAMLRMHAGYDHSYYFIATVIGDHIRYHADALKA